MKLHELRERTTRPARAYAMQTTSGTPKPAVGILVTVHGRPFSPHALSRCGEMRVDLADVVDVLDTPERSYPGNSSHGARRRVVAGNGLAVVVGEQDGGVITVLWDHQTHR